MQAPGLTRYFFRPAPEDAVLPRVPAGRHLGEAPRREAEREGNRSRPIAGPMADCMAGPVCRSAQAGLYLVHGSGIETRRPEPGVDLGGAERPQSRSTGRARGQIRGQIRVMPLEAADAALEVVDERRLRRAAARGE